MARLGAFDTQWLTRASFEPTAARRLRRLLPLVLALVAGVAAGNHLARGGTIVSTLPLERRNAELASELERTRMELQVERATRDELQRHADELSAKVTDLGHQLEFLNSRGAKPATATASQVIARE